MSDKPIYTITVEADHECEWPQQRQAILRMLKALKRSWGMRCVKIVPVNDAAREVGSSPVLGTENEAR